MHTNWKAAVTALLLGTTVSAGVLNIEGGAGAWNAAPSGSLRYEDSNWISAQDELGYDNEAILSLWATLEHALPFLPDLRLEYTGIDYGGRTHGYIGWGPWHYSDHALSRLTIDEYDAILYYALPGIVPWLHLDIGLDLKWINTRYFIEDDYGMEATYDESDSFVIPQGYLRARAGIPGTQLGVETQLQYIGNGSSTLYDVRLKADYTFTDLLPLLQPAVEIGYRTQRIKIDEEEYDTKVDLDLGGFYLGVMLRF